MFKILVTSMKCDCPSRYLTLEVLSCLCNYWFYCVDRYFFFFIFSYIGILLKIYYLIAARRAYISTMAACVNNHFLLSCEFPVKSVLNRPFLSLACSQA